MVKLDFITQSILFFCRLFSIEKKGSVGMCLAIDSGRMNDSLQHR